MNGDNDVRRRMVALPLPDRALCGNAKAPRTKGGFIGRNKRVKEQRATAQRAASAPHLRCPGMQCPLVRACGYSVCHAPDRLWLTERVRIDVLVRRDPLWSARRLDDDNLWRGMKSQIDGLADAGIVANDRQFCMGRITWEKAEPMQGEIILTLTPETEAA